MVVKYPWLVVKDNPLIRRLETIHLYPIWIRSWKDPNTWDERIERLREMRDLKQETLAQALGISQQAVSKMESSEVVDDERLKQVADVLGVSVEAIRHFSEEALFNNINNTFHDHSALVNYQFNPIDKIVELYERLLKSEQEKVTPFAVRFGGTKKAVGEGLLPSVFIALYFFLHVHVVYGKHRRDGIKENVWCSLHFQ